ncbi:hypothetical protein Acy02nite_60300 [Actinoplanes cyaneus]|uniref:Uncharacterized protein n=1 Tax=Actinoplanes cyaneus TaxID=52696 RepID=A0A919MA27_9ACTN|nr:hypothetical protein [Actinoplanes cyaneus]MCW2141487.1 hypothetical protein [Actinoplanes cyaneus]GID68149.1 hypothetical protein Acy02nite_60300 [Actinoplanes cyaneus]
MISGHDLVLVVAGDAGPVVRGFLDGWAARWPQMRVAAGAEAVNGFGSWPERAAQVPAGTGEVLVARDTAMESGWDDRGYAPDRRGEGPFALYYRPLTRLTTEVMAHQDPYERTGFRFDPYPMVLAGPGMSLLTLVAPEPDGDFTKALLAALVSSVPGPPLGDAR